MRVNPLIKAIGSATFIVVDASLAIDVVIGEAKRRALAMRFFAACQAANVRLIAPPLFANETDSIVRLAIHTRKLSASGGSSAYAVLDSLPVQITWDAAELNAARIRARAIAAMLQQPRVYDATYAALAEMRGCDFWTADKTFANAARQNRRLPDESTAPALPFVRFVGDY